MSSHARAANDEALESNKDCDASKEPTSSTTGMKRAMNTTQISEQTENDSGGAKEPVIRGDGTVLPERTDAQPRNPMKRTMDTTNDDQQQSK